MLILSPDKIESPSQSSPASTPTSSTASTASTLLVRTLGMSGDPRTTIERRGSASSTPIRYPSEYVKLNIGGSLHYTTISTLRKHDTMLRAMFGGRMEVLTDSEGNLVEAAG